MKIRIPEEFDKSIDCDLCHKEMDASIRPVKLRVYMGQNTIKTYKICDECTDKRLNIPKDSVNFLRCLQKFRTYNEVKYVEDWTKKATEVFIKYLKKSNIKLREYDIEICSEWTNGFSKSWKLMDLIKKHKINHFTLWGI